MSRELNRFVSDTEPEPNPAIGSGRDTLLRLRATRSAVVVLGRATGARFDRRRRHRQPISLQVTLLSPVDRRPLANGRILDLGLGGIRAQGLGLGEGVFEWAHAPLVPGTVVLLELNHPGDAESLIVQARVRWRRYDKLGLSFFSLTRETEQQLRHILAEAIEKGLPALR